jgi:hypothetical protein
MDNTLKNTNPILRIQRKLILVTSPKHNYAQLYSKCSDLNIGSCAIPTACLLNDKDATTSSSSDMFYIKDKNEAKKHKSHGNLKCIELWTR